MKTKDVVREVLDQLHRDQPAADRVVLIEVCRSQRVPRVNTRTSLRGAAAKLHAHLVPAR
ncbi:MAG TPA: hypothetical protein VHR66_31410 [Gemmataceae bacterium]|jgi:hypothetical protein|nr:hypothetical protein [Gemmataceae bacterium]